jgi:hypothetical protein
MSDSDETGRDGFDTDSHPGPRSEGSDSLRVDSGRYQVKRGEA